MNCPFTGRKCKCNIKDRLRLLFTTHAVYTKFFINSCLNNTTMSSTIYPDSPDIEVITNILIQNQKDIGEYISSLVPKNLEVQKNITDLLTSHILVAAAGVKAIKTQTGIEDAVKNIFENSDKVAEYLSSLIKVPLKDMFRQHNQYVIDITTLAYSGKYQEEYDTYNLYFNHMMKFSDTMSNSLTRFNWNFIILIIVALLLFKIL